jgi:2,4-dienoyl-CoA reductase-like NADH-dependent reductase (Old Yellow Enzyme family)/thioredoxin reductase
MAAGQAASASFEQAAAANIIKMAGNRCPHLLAPLAVRDKVLKNRIMYTVAGHFTFQGPENYPSEAYRNHYSNVAKNVAIVTVMTQFGKYPKTYHTRKDNPEMWGWEHLSNNKWEDIPPTWNYVERMLEDIHSEGSLAVFGANTGDVGDAVVTGDVTSESGKGGMAQYGSKPNSTGLPNGRGAGADAPGTTSFKSVEEIVADAKDKERLGYDVYLLVSSDPEAAQAVRNATNLVLIAPYGAMGGTSAKPGSAQLEKAIETARKLEGLADIFLMRGGGTVGASWEASKYEEGSAYYLAEAIKKAGVKINVCIGSGLHNPVKNDEYIAKGITDMVAMTRPIIADPELVSKISAGRADEVVPCIQCQNCHSESMTSGLHISRCTVNPQWEMMAYKLRSIEPPLMKKKVAVIGGGPAGMKAAIIAAQRGHKVTLYEKDAALGGQQQHTDYSTWVWTFKNYKDYLVNQGKKLGVEVKLNTKANPAMIKAAGYDTVLVALGSEYIKSKLSGTDATNIFDIQTCYSKKQSLGKNVVMVGAGKIGVETALSMALDGHNVTVLSANGEMIDPSDIGAHNVSTQTRLYKSLPNYKYFLNTTVTDITGGKVTFKDKDGATQAIQADSIVLWNGVKPRVEEAASFMNAAPEVRVLGDCNGQNGRIISATRNAFIVASRV